MDALNGKTHEAKVKYEVAILISGRRGLIQDRALAHERFGEYYLELEDQNEANYQMHKAVELYEEWGALAKCRQLRQKYSESFRPPAAIEVTG
jgi:histidine kinase